jgi:hypothetical protein
LKEFVKTFDFTGTTLDDALRDFLVTFRLPGEAQQIDAFMCSFANRWYLLWPRILVAADNCCIGILYCIECRPRFLFPGAGTWGTQRR